ncbi:unnamed protein product [Ilex paraguariensis]|uniref:Uncharacterized protein n=1 Tax=Ilex paraguariensis TaxID=185542 RepID=A0ABC8T2X3_9AQUA
MGIDTDAAQIGQLDTWFWMGTPWVEGEAPSALLDVAMKCHFGAHGRAKHGVGAEWEGADGAGRCWRGVHGARRAPIALGTVGEAPKVLLVKQD